MKNNNKKLSSNMEDYLEAIASIKKNKQVVRVKDISTLMNVKKPSVTSALGVLVKKGFIVHERYGYVDFTPCGKEKAEDIRHRHDMLVKFLSDILNIDSKVAQEDACRMEHAISPETFRKLAKFLKSMD